jgi:hypothetical protein
MVQFPGPSGSPWHTMEDFAQATARVQAAGGRFEDGICIWPNGRKQDGQEALMEMLFGRPMVYPPASVEEPVWINSAHLPWEQSPVPGVATKRLAYFHTGGPAAQLIRLEPGAATPAGVAGCVMVRFVFEGDTEYAAQPCPAPSNMYYPPGAPYAALSSPSGATILSLEFQAQVPGREPPLPYRI